jgi:hypothetical protein
VIPSSLPRPRRALMALVTALALGCHGPQSDTGFIIDVNTDMRWPEELDKVLIRIWGAGDKLSYERLYDVGRNAGQVALPGRLGLFPQGDGAAHFRVEVSGWLEADRASTTVIRTAVVGFVEHRILILPMNLERLCRATVCEAGRTCKGVDTRPSCEDETVDPAALATYVPPAVVMPGTDAPLGTNVVTELDSGATANPDLAPLADDAEIPQARDGAPASLDVASDVPTMGQPDAAVAPQVDAPTDSPPEAGALPPPPPPPPPIDAAAVADRAIDTTPFDVSAPPFDVAPDAQPVPLCGNGILDQGELCDPNSTTPCPTVCPRQGCVVRGLTGQGCNTTCAPKSLVSMCIDGDSCCPSSCTGANDTDCNKCGNGVLDGDETCEPGSATQCPTSCPMVGCTTRTLSGVDACHVSCVNSGTLTVCRTAVDGCCPSACNAASGNPSFDGDCTPKCGNSVLEGFETCDGNCAALAAACVSDANTIASPSGMVATCSFSCTTQLRPCMSGDGFCPGSCSSANDDDCKKVAGDVCGATPECMDGLSCTDSRCCSQSCATCQACTGPGGTCVNLNGSDDNNALNPCTGASTCSNGVCKLKDLQPCTAPGQCASNVCEAGKCRPFSCPAGQQWNAADQCKPISGACTSGNDCASGLCDRATSACVAACASNKTAASGLCIVLTMSPTLRSYGSVAVGTMSAAQTFIIQNVAPAPSGPPAVAINGTNASQFVISGNNCNLSLAPGASCLVSVVFRPTTTGAKIATLAVAVTADAVSASLTGTGF